MSGHTQFLKLFFVLDLSFFTKRMNQVKSYLVILYSLSFYGNLLLFRKKTWPFPSFFPNVHKCSKFVNQLLVSIMIYNNLFLSKKFNFTPPNCLYLLKVEWKLNKNMNLGYSFKFLNFSLLASCLILSFFGHGMFI